MKTWSIFIDKDLIDSNGSLPLSIVVFSDDMPDVKEFSVGDIVLIRVRGNNMEYWKGIVSLIGNKEFKGIPGMYSNYLATYAVISVCGRDLVK